MQYDKLTFGARFLTIAPALLISLKVYLLCKKKKKHWDMGHQLYQNFRGAQITPTYLTSGTGTSV